MKNITLKIENDSIHVAQFGKGSEQLVILSGIGDALKSVKGMAFPLSIIYRIFKKDYTVTFISRRRTKAFQSTKDMAIDLKKALDLLKISKCHLLGVSMGGMIAEHFAILYPDMLDKLILVVTSLKPNNTLNETIDEWLYHLSHNDYNAFMDSNLKRIYQKKYYDQNKFLIPLVAFFTKPNDNTLFLHHAKACKEHDASALIHTIKAKTLIIAGKKDQCLDYHESCLLHEKIPHSSLILYEAYGHGLYEEAKDFNQKVYAFLTSNDEFT